MKMPSALCGNGAKCIAIVLLIFGIGWLFGALQPMVICLAGVLMLVVGVFLIAGYLMSTGRLKSSYNLPERHLLNDSRHLAEWEALEGHFITIFKDGPEDSYQAIMVRFAVAINAMDVGQQTMIPSMSMVMMRKMLYEYWRRAGSLYFERYDERTAMNGPEVLRRLPDDGRPRFLEFCRSLDTPANGTSPVTRSDYPSAAEMAQR